MSCSLCSRLAYAALFSGLRSRTSPARHASAASHHPGTDAGDILDGHCFGPAASPGGRAAARSLRAGPGHAAAGAQQRGALPLRKLRGSLPTLRPLAARPVRAPASLFSSLAHTSPERCARSTAPTPCGVGAASSVKQAPAIPRTARRHRAAWRCLRGGFFLHRKCLHRRPRMHGLSGSGKDGPPQQSASAHAHPRAACASPPAQMGG